MQSKMLSFCQDEYQIIVDPTLSYYHLACRREAFGKSLKLLKALTHDLLDIPLLSPVEEFTSCDFGHEANDRPLLDLPKE